MKKRVIQAFAVVCCGVVMFSTGVTKRYMSAESTDTTEKYSTTAGISSVLTVNLDETYATACVSDSDSVITGTQAAIVYGYKNIGIANISEGNLNVREAADENSSLVGKMPVDSACDILDIDGQWAHISSGEVEGYVLAEYLLTGDEALNKAKTLVHTVAKVKESGLRVRKEPSTDSGILMTVAEGEQLEVLENQGEWIKVTMDDEVGYAYAEYVEVVDEIRDAMTLTEARYGEGVSDVRVAIIDNAIQYVGCPYVWGGTSLAHGCDCSGFTMGIMAQYGVYLPHSSRAQANCGTRISTSELKPGDLLFYGSGNYISHVAIYMGGGQIVHASDSRTGIIISNAFYRTPICATRVIYD